jgi:hypothetical protein
VSRTAGSRLLACLRSTETQHCDTSSSAILQFATAASSPVASAVQLTLRTLTDVLYMHVVVIGVGGGLTWVDQGDCVYTMVLVLTSS